MERLHYERLSTSFCKKARALLRGGACHSEGNVKRDLSNTQVLELLGYAPIVVEFAIIRLKFWASLLEFPEHHKIVMAAMFGNSVQTNSLDMHPRLAQLAADAQYLNFIDDIDEYKNEICASPILLLTDKHLNAQFVKADFSAIRVAFLSSSVAPPSCLCPSVAPPPGGLPVASGVDLPVVPEAPESAFNIFRRDSWAS
jgi:hypothetical protein